MWGSVDIGNFPVRLNGTETGWNWNQMPDNITKLANGKKFKPWRWSCSLDIGVCLWGALPYICQFLAILSFWGKERNFNHQNTGRNFCHMGHCQQAPGRKTTYDILCPLPNIQRVFQIFSMMQTLILPDSRKGKGIIRYGPAWTIALSCCLKDVADPCWSKISTRGIRFGMVWQCRAGIWSRALKDLAYQRPWRTASGSNLDIKRDNTVATCCRRNFPVVSCFPEGFPTSNLGRRKHVAQTLWMPWPKKVAQNVSYGCKCFTSFLLLFSSAWWGEKQPLWSVL